MIILCDQLSRNIFVGSKRMFDYDHIALKYTKYIMEDRSRYDEYKAFEKYFILMPLMHSENYIDLQTCIKECQKIIDYSKTENEYMDYSEFFEKAIVYATNKQ